MIEVPDWGTVPRMLRDRAAHHPDVTAVLDGDVALTIGELRRRAGEVARALRASGVRPGDRVAVWAPNTWQWVVVAFGIWDAAAVIVPLSTRGKGLETADVLRRTGARVLFTVSEFLGVDYPELLGGVAGAPREGRPYADLDLAEVVLLDGEPGRGGVVSCTDFLTRAAAVPEADAERVALSVAPGDPFEILMTSGTTGVPKGVVLDGGQILRAYWDWSEICGLTAGDRFPVVSPFAHGFGINAGLLVCVARLATIVPIAVFDPDTALDLVERLQLTVLAGPPNLFARILAHPELGERAIASLRWAIVGAASVPTELVRDMQDRLGFERVTNAYGLIEGSAVTMTRAGDPAELVASTAGRAVPGMATRIVDEAGRPLPAGERGELQVHGYGVMHGYWDAPELTAAAFTDDGWLRTGDIGVLDEDGNLAIVGRKKEMFIVGGFNTYPAEIENLLLHCGDVAAAAVVGVPDAALGEVPWAFVVLRPGATVSDADVVAWARANMSNYKVPRRVVLVDELPVTANGKVDKLALQQRAGAGDRVAVAEAG